MKLLIISNMAHYYRDGQLRGHGPTAREISHLGQLFDEISHIGCLYPGPASDLFLPYETEKIRFIPVPPAGGSSLRDKFDIVAHIPAYLRAILRELPRADVVHIRAPANISLLAMVLLAFVRHPQKRWIKYAGNWKPRGREAKSYTFQRWWLSKNLSRGVVTINGAWSDTPSHVQTFFNPCLTKEELETGRRAAAVKALQAPVQLLFVGRLDSAKGADRVLAIAAELQKRGIAIALELIGDGDQKEGFIRLAQQLGIGDTVRFRGWLPRQGLEAFYNRAHFLLLPSSSEGWPKVLSEAMAYGAVPLASNVSSISQYLRQFKTGRALDAGDIEGFVDALCWYTQHPEAWKTESEHSVKAAVMFSYSNYLQAVRELLGISLPT